MTDYPSKMSKKVMEKYWKVLTAKHGASAPFADVVAQCDPEGTGKEREERGRKIKRAREREESA